MASEKAFACLVIIAIILAVCGVVCHVNAWVDCNGRNGVLVKTADPTKPFGCVPEVGR